jgi:hypothetical protein
LIELAGHGKPDLSKACSASIGAWDKWRSITGMAICAGSDEQSALDGIIASALRRGLYFMSDADARPDGSAHPQANLWDNGPDVAGELERLMGVRKAALTRFGLNAINQGRRW